MHKILVDLQSSHEPQPVHMSSQISQESTGDFIDLKAVPDYLRQMKLDEAPIQAKLPEQSASPPSYFDVPKPDRALSLEN